MDVSFCHGRCARFARPGFVGPGLWVLGTRWTARLYPWVETARISPGGDRNRGSRKQYVRDFTCSRGASAWPRSGQPRSSALGYIRSGMGTPSRPRPVLSTPWVRADSASRLDRSEEVSDL